MERYGRRAVVDFQHASVRNPRHLRRAAKIARQVRTAGAFGNLRLILQGFGANLDVVEGQFAGSSFFQRDFFKLRPVAERTRSVLFWLSG